MGNWVDVASSNTMSLDMILLWGMRSVGEVGMRLEKENGIREDMVDNISMGLVKKS